MTPDQVLSYENLDVPTGYSEPKAVKPTPEQLYAHLRDQRNRRRVSAALFREATDIGYDLTKEVDVRAATPMVFRGTDRPIKPQVLAYQGDRPEAPAQPELTPTKRKGLFARAKAKLAEYQERHYVPPETRKMRRNVAAAAMGVLALFGAVGAGSFALGRHSAEPANARQAPVELEFSAAHAVPTTAEAPTTTVQAHQATPEFHLSADQEPAFAVMVQVGGQMPDQVTFMRTLNFAAAVQQAQAHPGA